LAKKQSKEVLMSPAEIEALVAGFKAEKGAQKIVAFSGGSEEKATAVQVIIEDIVNGLVGLPVAILTGGTKWGVPKTAADVARVIGLPVIGVYPERGQKYLLPNLDLAIKIPPRYRESEWGDESEVFVKLSDAIVMLSGSFGTQIEYSHLMKMNERRLKDSAAPVFLVPISGIGGWSQLVCELPLTDNARACLPASPIGNGHEAVAFLRAKLFQ